MDIVVCFTFCLASPLSCQFCLDQWMNVTEPLETFFEIFSKEAEIAFSFPGLKMMLSWEPFLRPPPSA